MSSGVFVHPPQDDFAGEPIPGLPADLPEGEKLLWQGSPGWRSQGDDLFCHPDGLALHGVKG
jgi:hypothetical protein